MLNRRHAKLLRILQDAQDRGERLRYHQIAKLMGLKGPSSITPAVGHLVDRGFVRMAGPNGYGQPMVVRRIESITDGEPVSDDPLVAFIHHHQIETDGATPSFREIQAAMGLRSISRIGLRLERLAEQGAVTLYGDGQRKMTMVHVTKRNTA